MDLRDTARLTILAKKQQFGGGDAGEEVQQEDYYKYLDYCECCDQLIGSPLTMCQPLHELSFLGNGNASFFYFQVGLMLTLLPTYLVAALHGLITNYQNARPLLQQCGTFC